MNVDNRREVNPWVPMTDRIDLMHLGKLVEELGELQAAAARCIIQGIGETEPVTGKLNRLWLQEEVADVLANIELVSQRFALDYETISLRVARKKGMLRLWHMISEKE